MPSFHKDIQRSGTKFDRAIRARSLPSTPNLLNLRIILRVIFMDVRLPQNFVGLRQAHVYAKFPIVPSPFDLDKRVPPQDTKLRDSLLDELLISRSSGFLFLYLRLGS
jgi:hypothetical protein